MKHLLILSRALAISLALTTTFALADWPERPVRMVVPYAAGSGVDVAMRPVADALARELGQPVVVDNRGGAGGLIGTQVVATAAPDGYTIGFGNVVTLAINRSFYTKLPYDPESLIPVGLAVGNPYVVIARNDFPASNFRELIAYARSNPGRVMMGSPGHGSAGHLAAAMIESATGISFSMVPYKTGYQGVGDMVNKQLDVMMENIAAVGPFVADKRVKALAVTSLTRAVSMPGVPTVDESGIQKYEILAWGGLVAPAGTPRPVVLKLNAALARAMQDPKVTAAHKALSIDAHQSTPEQFAELIQRETVRWGEMVKRTGVKAD
ncbi:Bug family tripartite tricarboxylate transporter substrate binding protein [Ottowia sp. VDI28]|uniref:Bug family tripartite tricarboxylate transporter substrate binding protein n=1 Tax=Ottowia sp. VDI28 TaxID=3133968 RepID=UPI003C2F31BF